MQSHTVLVTGATSGLGLATARALAAQGAAVIIHGPTDELTTTATDLVRRENPGASVEGVSADFTSQQEVRRLAKELEACGPIDVVVNNAGAIFDHYATTVDGVELTFAVNHLAPYLLTRLLIPSLEERPHGRVVIVASEAHRKAKLDPSRPGPEQRYRRVVEYEKAKLANLHFAYELARRLEGTRVTVHAAHPGTVRTQLFRPRNPIEAVIMRILDRKAVAPEEACDTIVWLASTADLNGQTGGYYADRKPLESSPTSYDEDAARRMWELSAELTGLDP